jgi:transcriptional regulator with AAA-type ATPase domain
MKIPALIFTCHAEQLSTLPVLHRIPASCAPGSLPENLSQEYTELDAESPQFWLRLSDGKTCAVLIPEQFLEICRQSGDIFHNCGRKLPSRQLSYYANQTPSPKIPVIDGNYPLQSRQIIRSIRDLLTNSQLQEKIRKNYPGGWLMVIGVKKEIFKMAMEKNSFKSTASSQPEAGFYKSISLAGDHPGDRNLQILKAFSEDGWRDTAELADRYLGRSPAAEVVRQVIVRAAETDDPVLIVGPTGTGKGLVAALIHELWSKRKQKQLPIKTLNCGSIPDPLFESELFGYKKGAFTGAMRDTDGIWKSAQDGTLFLDEIGDLPLYQQAKILTAIESKVIRPVGSTEDEQVQARIMCATNRDLGSMMLNNTFRVDLYQRIRGITVRTPALRDHLTDLSEIANHIWLTKTNDDQPLGSDLIEELLRYSWPGNVRQLKQTIYSLRAYFQSRPLHIKHLHTALLLEGIDPAQFQQCTHRSTISLENIRRIRYLNEILQIVTSTAFLLRPVLAAADAVDSIFDPQAMLGFRLQELGNLCHNSFLLSDLLGKEVLKSLNNLQSKLHYLHHLLTTNPRSVAQVRGEVAEQFTEFVRQLQAEIDGSI